MGAGLVVGFGNIGVQRNDRVVVERRGVARRFATAAVFRDHRADLFKPVDGGIGHHDHPVVLTPDMIGRLAPDDGDMDRRMRPLQRQQL